MCVCLQRVLIVDYIVGGGFAEEDLPVSILAEGYSILRSCIEQFAQLGFKISTLIDHRLMEHIRISPIHEFKSVSSHEDFVTGIKDFSDQVDYALTLAPESKGILKDLSSILINSQATFLGSNPDSIEQAGDKLKTMELAKTLDLNVPVTIAPSYNDSIEKIMFDVDVLGYPLIVKPIDGVGCQGLTKVTNPQDLSFGLQAAHAVTSMDNCIVQEFIEGTPISTSLLVNGENVVPISINHQNLRIDSKKKIGNYLGGEVPYLIPEFHDEVIETSVKLVEQMDLNGFVGVDLIVGDEGVFVIEVNPRVTVPFIAINELSNKNMANELLEIVEKGKTSGEIKLNGFATFSKIMVPTTYNKIPRFERVAIIDGVLSPPFPVGNNSHSYALLMGLGSTIDMARKNFRNIKNEVLKNLS